MESKLVALFLGVALVLATATIYTQSVWVVSSSGRIIFGNGITGVPCSKDGSSEHNPNCGGTGPSGEGGMHIPKPH